MVKLGSEIPRPHLPGDHLKSTQYTYPCQIIDALEVYSNIARDKVDDRREVLRVALQFCNEFLQVEVRVFWVSNNCGGDKSVQYKGFERYKEER